MTLKRQLLDLLTRAELLDLADRFEVDVPDRRVKSQLVDALGASHRASLQEMLPTLARDRLKDLCAAVGLDTSGREKAALVERLLSGDSGKAPASETPPTEQPKRAKGKAAKKNGGDLGFEDKLWQAADELRGNMDAAEYKHVVLGLIFLKYVSDAFAERQRQLEAEKAQGADPEDPDEYRAQNVFWVPKAARWQGLQTQAKQPTIGKLVDDAMIAIEHDNPSLKGVLPKDYARPSLDKLRLGALIDLISTIALGDAESRKKDILGRVYEYFLSEFASAEGKKGGQFYTPRCVVKLLVEMLEPYKGRIFDPCCGSGGMFVQSEKFVEAHGA